MSIIAITVQTGKDLDSPIDQRFGRAPYFLLVDTDTGEVSESVTNEAAEAAHAAGPAAARLVAQHKAEAVVSGAFGPKAADALRTLGIKLFELGSARSAKEALEGFRARSLRELP